MKIKIKLNMRAP